MFFYPRFQSRSVLCMAALPNYFVSFLPILSYPYNTYFTWNSFRPALIQLLAFSICLFFRLAPFLVIDFRALLLDTEMEPVPPFSPRSEITMFTLSRLHSPTVLDLLSAVIQIDLQVDKRRKMNVYHHSVFFILVTCVLCR